MLDVDQGDPLLARLGQLAGNCPQHTVIQPSGPRKYAWQKYNRGNDAPLTPDLLAAHLAGTRTVRSELRWIVGEGHDRRAVAYTLRWAADNAQDLEARTKDAARLATSGARPVLGRSPSATHAGGGRLWPFFAAAVDRGAAWATAFKHAQGLAPVRECWPSWQMGPDDRGQAVRLPAGVYRRDGMCAPIPHVPWEPMRLVWRTGRAAAALLLTEVTPAAWAAEPAPPLPTERPSVSPLTLDLTLVAPTAAPPESAAWHDPRWLARYGHNRDQLPIAVTEKAAIGRFNTRHDVCELLSKCRNGYARAVWRSERTPSIGYLPNNAWIDYGRGGRSGGGRGGGAPSTPYTDWKDSTAARRWSGSSCPRCWRRPGRSSTGRRAPVPGFPVESPPSPSQRAGNTTAAARGHRDRPGTGSIGYAAPTPTDTIEERRGLNALGLATPPGTLVLCHSRCDASAKVSRLSMSRQSLASNVSVAL